MLDAHSSRSDPVEIREEVKKGLSEVRTTVLGCQILLGFQYEALFQNSFQTIAALRKALELTAFGLLLLAMVLMIAPAAFHQISEKGRSTVRQKQFTKLMVAVSLAPFALAIGVNVVVATGAALGLAGAAELGVGAAMGAAFLWYGVPIMAAQPRGAARPDETSADTSLTDRIGDLMTETRIVLPGVQAFLGFQFAAYLTEAFNRLPPDARLAHDVSLALLLASMIFLVTPAPFHRLAEDGRPTERVCRLTATMILLALATLTLALSADLYVAAKVVAKDTAFAAVVAISAAVVSLSVWFGYPLYARWRTPSERPAAALEDGARHA
jgi:hypothetical protein